MNEELANNSKLKAEYTATFDADERMYHSMLAVTSKVTHKPGRVKIEDLVINKFKRLSREESVKGLTSIIKGWGVASPIHVMTTNDGENYDLIDGLRRVVAAKRNGDEELDAIIWDFEDKIEGKKFSRVLALLLNRSERFRNKEIWEIVQLLDRSDGLSTDDIEFLCSLQGGDYMKLKDVMMADSDYAEIKESFILGDLSIDGAYKKLVNARKKEDRLAKDDEREIAAYDSDGNAVAGNSEESEKLGMDEVLDILGIVDSGESLEKDLDNFKGVAEIEADDSKGDGRERRPIPKEIRQSTFNRDGYTCQVCMVEHSRPELLHLLVYHHRVLHAQGGPDSVDNGLTLCQSCHMMVHFMLKHGVMSKKEDFDNIESWERVQRAKKAGLPALKVYEEMRKKGKANSKAFEEENEKGMRHLRPDENKALNEDALRASR